MLKMTISKLPSCLPFLLGVEKRRERRSSDLHRALRAELLTAKASDTQGTVDFRLSALDFYSLCRTDITAYSAADA